MSGIVGILNLDGAPVDRDLLCRLTRHMQRRGPDAQETWLDGHVGFGHAMLRTTFESEHERQPFSLDGDVWITADARVDAREELVEKLTSRGRRSSSGATDAELILHAYDAWGEDCVHHLIGDFAFAIWDGRERRLFCARDQFGVKQLYYSMKGGRFVISNSLTCIRQHPTISSDINESAVADFLLFGVNKDPFGTMFGDVRRLPPGHKLICCSGTFYLTRYWSLPFIEETHYARPRDCVEGFSDLVGKAVKDRLRTEKAGVLMTGGLDSTTVAATAQRVFAQRNAAFDLRAVTGVYHCLIPDNEGYFSSLVANALQIPIQHVPSDDYRPYERVDGWEFQTPEPSHWPFHASYVALIRNASAHARTVLSGEGGDVVLEPSTGYLEAMLRSYRLYRLARDLAWFFVRRHRVPRLGFRTMLRRRLGMPSVSRQETHPLPRWLNSSFIERLELQSRLEAANKPVAGMSTSRPEAYQLLTDPFWPYMFKLADPDVTGLPVETCYPFFDTRIVSFCLGLPSLPWCYEKVLLRMAMRGRLPPAVLKRPKTYPVGRSACATIKQAATCMGDLLMKSPLLSEWVDIRKAREIVFLENPDEIYVNLRPVTLSYWLHNLTKARALPEEGALCGTTTL